MSLSTSEWEKKFNLTWCRSITLFFHSFQLATVVDGIYRLASILTRDWIVKNTWWNSSSDAVVREQSHCFACARSSHHHVVTDNRNALFQSNSFHSRSPDNVYTRQNNLPRLCSAVFKLCIYAQPIIYLSIARIRAEAHLKMSRRGKTHFKSLGTKRNTFDGGCFRSSLSEYYYFTRVYACSTITRPSQPVAGILVSSSSYDPKFCVSRKICL